jgi:hypothetical protein
MALSFYRIYKSKQGGNAFSPPKSGPSSCPPRKEQTHWHDQPWRRRCRAARTLTYLSQSKKAEAVTNTEDTRKDKAGAHRVGRATDRGAALRWCLALSVRRRKDRGAVGGRASGGAKWRQGGIRPADEGGHILCMAELDTAGPSAGPSNPMWSEVKRLW